MEPLLLGMILKVETRGWSGPAPKLPRDPVRVEVGADAYQLFYYDLSPKDQGLTVSDACQRVVSRIERMFLRDRPPLPEGPYALRMRLDVGLFVDSSASSISYTWPLDFLQALSDAGIELSVSHYLPKSDDEDDEDDE